MEFFWGKTRRPIVPRSQITPWLEEKDKEEYRKTIASYLDIFVSIEQRVSEMHPNPLDTLTAEQHKLVTRFVDNYEVESWINFSRAQYDSILEEYISRLVLMAPHCLYAYHEAMNPHEVPNAAHHHLFIDNLMEIEAGRLGTLLIAAPAGSSKSQYASRSFAQWWIGRNPSKRILAAGNTMKFIEKEISTLNRNAIETETYHRIFPDIELDSSSRGADFWRIKNNRGSYKCVGAEGAVAGVRADMFLLDDLFPQASAAQREGEREKVKRWLSADILSRMKPGIKLVAVNTIFHSEDAMSFLISQSEKQQKTGEELLPGPTKFIRLAAECDDEENDPLGRKLGEFIWPEFYKEEHWNILKANLTAYEWNCIYQNRPSDIIGTNIDESDFKYFSKYPENIAGSEDTVLKTVATVDCAMKASERSDFSVVSIFRQHVDKTWYMVDIWREQKSLSAIAEAIIKLNRIWDINYAIIEEAGMGFQLLDEYSGKLLVPLIAYSPHGKGSKEFRADKIWPYIKTGMILFPQQKAWMQETKKELIGFPNAKHDDIVDTLSILVDSEFSYARGGTRKLKMR